MSLVVSSGPTSRVYFSQRLRLHYVDWGNPSAPPLLLVHGGRDHCRNWDWVAERLIDRYRIIAPDLRGHGDSAWAHGGGYSEMHYVYDIAQLVHQKQMAPVTIIGHSLGGSIALLYAGLFPETIAKVVAIEGLGPSPDMLKRQRETPEGLPILTCRLLERGYGVADTRKIMGGNWMRVFREVWGE